MLMGNILPKQPSSPLAESGGPVNRRCREIAAYCQGPNESSGMVRRASHTTRLLRRDPRREGRVGSVIAQSCFESLQMAPPFRHLTPRLKMSRIKVFT
jgi:hypothetical protein